MGKAVTLVTNVVFGSDKLGSFASVVDNAPCSYEFVTLAESVWNWILSKIVYKKAENRHMVAEIWYPCDLWGFRMAQAVTPVTNVVFGLVKLWSFASVVDNAWRLPSVFAVSHYTFDQVDPIQSRFQWILFVYIKTHEGVRIEKRKNQLKQSNQCFSW